MSVRRLLSRRHRARYRSLIPSFSLFPFPCLPPLSLSLSHSRLFWRRTPVENRWSPRTTATSPSNVRFFARPDRRETKRPREWLRLPRAEFTRSRVIFRLFLSRCICLLPSSHSVSSFFSLVCLNFFYSLSLSFSSFLPTQRISCPWVCPCVRAWA